jgi:hypothetical protein
MGAAKMEDVELYLAHRLIDALLKMNWTLDDAVEVGHARAKSELAGAGDDVLRYNEMGIQNIINHMAYMHVQQSEEEEDEEEVPPLVESGSYLFMRLNEDHVSVKISKDLDEFRDFCHYAGLSDWDEHKQVILQNIAEHSIYVFTGNDTWYYVAQHDMWTEDEDSEAGDVGITVE